MLYCEPGTENRKAFDAFLERLKFFSPDERAWALRVLTDSYCVTCGGPMAHASFSSCVCSNEKCPASKRRKPSE